MALDTSVSKYDDMIAEMNAAKAEMNTPISPELEANAALYGAEGTYGQGAIAKIRAAQVAGTSQGMAGLVSSGMSSGNLAAGVASRYAREANTAIQGVEDTRYDKLSAAMMAVAAAKEARVTGTANLFATTAGFMTQAYNAEVAANEAKYATDVTTAQNKYATDVNANTNKYSTDVQANSAKYNADVAANTSKYATDIGLKEAQLSANTSATNTQRTISASQSSQAASQNFTAAENEKNRQAALDLANLQNKDSGSILRYL